MSGVKNKEMEDLKMTVYVAQVVRRPQNISQLTEKLKTLNIYDNSVIRFLSDNDAVNVGVNDTTEARIVSKNS